MHCQFAAIGTEEHDTGSGAYPTDYNCTKVLIHVIKWPTQAFCRMVVAAIMAGDGVGILDDMVSDVDGRAHELNS